MEDRSRCGWHGQDPVYRAYHDTEWGVPETDSRALWEKLILDGFQAGLSWITILKKGIIFAKPLLGLIPIYWQAGPKKTLHDCCKTPGLFDIEVKLRQPSRTQGCGRKSNSASGLQIFYGPM